LVTNGRKPAVEPAVGDQTAVLGRRRPRQRGRGRGRWNQAEGPRAGVGRRTSGRL